MTINALNSGAKVWLADLEDANTPLWENVVGGQLNLRRRDRPARSTSPRRRARTTRSDDDARRPSWSGRAAGTCRRSTSWSTAQPISGSLFDFGALLLPLRAARRSTRARARTSTCRRWRATSRPGSGTTSFVCAQDALGIPRGTIRATVLIETYPAAFEMEEILYELREHSAGLNAGRWDYMFSVIKKFRTRGRGLPAAGPQRGDDDRAVHARLHRAAGAHLPQARRARDRRHGGVHPQPATTPRSTRPRSTKVRDDKTREAGDGFDGSWVAHPDLVPLCREVFDAVLGDRPNQLDRHARGRARSRAEQLLDVAATPGEVTEAGLRNNVSVGMQYLEAWLRGTGAVGDLQPDGGRRHRRDLPLPGLAVAAQRRRARRRPDGHPRAGRADHRRGAGQRSASGRRRGLRRRAGGTTRAACSPRWRWPTTSPSS